MKIVALANDLSARGGGIPPGILPVYEELTGRGVEIALVTAKRPDSTLRTRVIIYKTLGPKALNFSPDLLRILKRERPDLVHLHGLWTYASIAARIWKLQTGKPVVVSPH